MKNFALGVWTGIGIFSFFTGWPNGLTWLATTVVIGVALIHAWAQSLLKCYSYEDIPAYGVQRRTFIGRVKGIIAVINRWLNGQPLTDE